MSNFELEIEELKKKIAILEGKKNQISTYSFSNIKFQDLENLVEIKQNFENKIFDSWFNNEIVISEDIEKFFKELINENRFLIKSYNEEDLKINLIVPILKLVKFKSFEKNFRDFYELPLRYETDKFIFKGITDFVVSKGLKYSQKPYFFIQEFKKGQENSDPEPQLLAELISAVEMNSWKKINGAYIIGAIWNFVILEKLEKGKYQYFVSENFDSTKIEDLKNIYKNLVFVKNEIFFKF